MKQQKPEPPKETNEAKKCQTKPPGPHSSPRPEDEQRRSQSFSNTHNHPQKVAVETQKKFGTDDNPTKPNSSLSSVKPPNVADVISGSRLSIHETKLLNTEGETDERTRYSLPANSAGSI
jgi:hypothetical protein